MKLTLQLRPNEVDQRLVKALNGLFANEDFVLLARAVGESGQVVDTDGPSRKRRFSGSEPFHDLLAMLQRYTGGVYIEAASIEGVEALLPRHKHDLERVARLAVKPQLEIAPFYADLLEWVQDINWPVAPKVASLLRDSGIPLVPYIRTVLGTEDDIWKYWVLSYVVQGSSSEVVGALKDEITRIARMPTSGEALEEVDQVARAILAAYGEVQ
ncbi:MAG TPA: DUF5071 domain-containing protein [Anaerolineales bacterium]|nr:DUF5071 domain-containing protein [Anaerolineales bacterium]